MGGVVASPMTCLVRAGGILALSLWCAAHAKGQTFSKVLYLHGGPPANASTFAAIRAAGFDAVSVSGVGADFATPAASGLRFYRDQIVGKGVLELRDQEFEPIRTGYLERRRPDELIRPGCLTDPDVTVEVRTRMARELNRLSAAALGVPPLGIALADEPSLTSHINPLDLCFKATCLREFRRWLQARYGGSLDALNLAWKTDSLTLSLIHI